jgi:Na+:H+ antiporter, NhaA family
MPIFVLANAGVALDGLTFDGTTTKLVLAVRVGLILGKPTGVLLACQMKLRLKVASLPLRIVKTADEAENSRILRRGVAN